MVQRKCSEGLHASVLRTEVSVGKGNALLLMCLLHSSTCVFSWNVMAIWKVTRSLACDNATSSTPSTCASQASVNEYDGSTDKFHSLTSNKELIISRQVRQVEKILIHKQIVYVDERL